MNSLKRTVSLLVALALVLPSAAYPAFADEATTTPATDGTTISAADASASSTDSGPVIVDNTALTASAATTTDTAATSTAVEDSSSAATSTATATESDTTLHVESAGAPGTTTQATSTPDLAASTPSVAAVPVLLDVATTTEASTGTATGSPDLLVTTATVGTSSPSIVTGDAAAGANVINVADSNFVNSSGSIVLSNYFASTTGIDLRNATSSFATGALCILFTCTGGQGVTLNLSATSSLSNLLVLNSTSGGNHISGTGTAAILTGDALTGLNLANLANLNVVDSNYFVALLNAFRGIQGDLVFPSLYGFFSALASGSVPTSLSLDSTAAVDNQIGIHADTGGNATDATSSAIRTGNTLAFGNLVNQLNSNLIGGSNLAILLRVSGAWNGQVFSAPDGLSILRGTDGSILLYAAGSGAGMGTDASLAATSSAAIANHIDLGAFTGANGITGADSARIITGNALIGANVLNLANQNIIGRNWLTAIVNVFGDFNGNIAFGRPDLWVGERVEAPAQVVNGSDLIFHFTVTNKGDAPATIASLAASLDASHLSFTDSLTKDLGTLNPGQSEEVVLHAKVNAPAGTTLATSGTATEHETDNNAADNTDHVSILVGPVGGGGGGAVHRTSSSATLADALVVTRHTIAAVVNGTHRTIHEELSVSNPSEATSTPVDLHDLLKDPNGTVIHDEAWPLDTLAPHEEVTVTYDVTFDSGAPAGWYPLSTVLASAAGDTELRNNGSIFVIAVPVAHAGNASVSAGGGGMVRGVSTSTPIVSTDAKNPLLAAASLASVPWTYALGFALTAALLAGFLWAAAALRRRTIRS